MTAVVLLGLRLPGTGRPVDVRLAGGLVDAIAGPGELDVRPGDAVEHGAGAYLVPGLVDAHVHWSTWAGVRQRIDVAAAGSAAQVVDLLVAGTRDDVVLGHGFRDALWSDPPHKDLLQAALPGVQVAVVSHDLHSVWLSPAALARLGREHPTGLLREQDSLDVQHALAADQRVEVVDRWVAQASAAAAARGITEIIDFEFADNIADWTRRGTAGDLAVRVRASVWRPWLDAAIAAGLRTGDDRPGTSGLVRVGPFKVIADGSLNTRTAFCYHRYPDPADEHGVLLIEPAELRELVVRAARHGLHPAVHAIGDHATTIVLDVLDAAGGPRRIEHAQLVAPADLPRFADPALVTSIQPQHAPADRDVADRHWSAVAEHAFPYGALAAAGATLHLGSDAPVAEPDPWRAIAAAVSRTTDDRPPWHPAQALSVPDALAAAAAGRRTVVPGSPADLVLVPADPLRTAPRDLAAMPVLATFRAGEPTHRADP